MYGLWLFKEIKTEYGYCKVEIYRRGYNGSQIEIGALSADSLNISLENLGTITDPIGKSVCSFSIIDTDQISYDDFFTPDATAYKVVVSSRVGSGAYVTRWSGYVTPDFFAENLSYRTPISLTARDNIGYLSDVDFDLSASTITVRELITSAFAKIAEPYPMSLVFATQKQTVEGVLAIDATISTALLRDMTWYEALETVLHDLGLQMRWVDNNTIAVIDVSQIPEYYTTQGFNFINASGYREILPAWREFRQEQNYGAFDNFYRGQINGADKLEYAANSAISSNVLLYQPAPKTQWAREGAIYFLNLFNSYNQYIDDNKAESIYVTGIAPTATNAEVLATKMVYSQDVTQVNKQIELKFNLNDTLRTPVESLYTRGEYNVFYLPYSIQTGGVSQTKTPRPYQLKYRFNIFLRCKDGSNYVMREDWVDASTVNTEQPFIEFTTEKLKTVNTNISDAQGNKRFVFTGYNNDEQYTITINSIPKAGTLEFVVYPWTFEGEDTARETATYQRGARISDIQFAVKLNTTGITSGTLVGENHNVKSSFDYQFGQVPKFDGDLIAYAGGLFYGDTLTAINGFQRNADSTNYNLLELVGREVIHYNRKNYNKLSGTIKNLDKEPLMFNRLFVREGKTYAPFAYSLNVISNEMNITTMQEVEPYETASFTQIESEVSTGGATVGGGNNTVLQYSENAGNAKRIYELSAATATEKNDGYLIIDNDSFGEAKKVHISEVKDAELRDDFNALEERLNALGLSVKEENGKQYLESSLDFYSKGAVSSGGNSTTQGGGGSNVSYSPALSGGTLLGTIDINGVPNAIYAPTTLPNPYALTINGTTYDGSSPVDITISGGGGVADSIDWANVYNKPTTLGGYGITDAVVGGKGNGYTVFRYNGFYIVNYGGSDWRLTNSGWQTEYKILHADNYSNYALPKSGGTIKNGSVRNPLSIDTTDSTGAYLVMMANGVDKAYFGYDSSLGALIQDKSGSYSTLLYIREGNGYIGSQSKWNTLIHSGNIGSYNAGSASKLLTNSCEIAYNDRTTLAQFKLTGEKGGYSGMLFRNAGDGLAAIDNGNTCGIFVTNIHWLLYYNRTNDIASIDAPLSLPNALKISSNTPNGSLDITDDYSNEWRRVFTALSPNMAVNQNYSLFFGKANNKHNGAVITYQHTGDGSTANKMWFGLHSADRLMSILANGNVLIGTTTDNGGRLQVAQNDWEGGLVLNRTVANSGAAILVQTMGVPIGSFGLNGNKKYEFNVRNSSGTSTTVMSCDANGNFYATGGISCGSDSRYKTRIKDVSVDIETIAKAPLFVYKWADREDDKLHLGTTAQYWYDTDFRNAVVPTNDEKLWTMSYGEIAMGNTIVLAREQLKVKSEVERLKERVNELETELNKYRRA